jgi:hypothetical protein
MDSTNEPKSNTRQSARVWAKYSSLSLQWAVVFLIAAWVGSGIDRWLNTDRPYSAALTTILAVVWVMRSLIHSMSDHAASHTKQPVKPTSIPPAAKRFWNPDRIFWMSFLFVLLSAVSGIEVTNQYFIPVDRAVLHPLLLAHALPVAFMFLSLYPIRQYWPDFFNRSKVLFSLVFIGFHFIISLLILIVLMLKSGGLSVENATPFLLFFFIFLGALFVGIFSILCPISKVS